MPKFIFITGGVVSGIGKGITAASAGLLLKSSGFKVDVIKFDPYLNIDPGTMSPYEHGEVYVLDDGSETDLDLGHYERFLNTNLNKNSSVTAGKIYKAILENERDGYYLGKNVQLIPHVTNYIQECFQKIVSDSDHDVIRLIEIGGSTGDIEGEIFLESFRQFKQKKGSDVLHIHLGYIPFLHCSGEFKTKPLQNSIRELLSKGLQPDIVVARYKPENDQHLSKDILEKIALFCNIPGFKVISLPDLSSIYEVPLYLQKSSLIQCLQEFTGENIRPQLPSFFNKMVVSNSLETNEHPNYSTTSEINQEELLITAENQIYNAKNATKKIVEIALVAKYTKLTDAYLSLLESLKIAAVENNVEIKVNFIEAENLSPELKNTEKYTQEMDKLKKAKGIIVPGGFGSRGMEGKIAAINYARTNKIPFLGICLGLQMAVVEYARNVININAFSSEMLEDRNLAQGDQKLVVDLMPTQLEIHKKGGTMRLGGYDCTLNINSLAARLFGKTEIRERHRHRLEVQPEYVEQLEQNGLSISGKYYFKDSNLNKQFLVEMVELSQDIHPFFIATQSHPEFLSRPEKSHPLFYGLVKAASD